MHIGDLSDICVGFHSLCLQKDSCSYETFSNNLNEKWIN